MKKIFAVAMVFVLVLSGCAKKTAIKTETDCVMSGSIVEVYEKSILVTPDEGEQELSSGTYISVGLGNAENNFNVGEHVKVTYDGNIMETDPPQISAKSIEKTDALANKTKCVMVKGEIYYDTGKESDIDSRCGNPDGIISSTADSTQLPTQDNQSNFGTDYGYQFVDENSIDVNLDGIWERFEKR